MRRQIIWLVTLPLILAGIESAHALGNELADSTRGELFSSPASGGNAIPLAVATLAAVIAAALVARANGAWWESHRSTLVAAPFAALPPVGFVVLELVEGIARPGPLTSGDVLDRAFVIGFALQLPVAYAGWLLARLLLRAVDAVRAARAAAAPPRLRARVEALVAAVDALVPLAVVAVSRGRGPPRSLVFDPLG